MIDVILVFLLAAQIVTLVLCTYYGYRLVRQNDTRIYTLLAVFILTMATISWLITYIAGAPS